MNETVRTYLIEVARQKDKFVFYSDVVKDCKLDINLNSEYGQLQFTLLLSEVSEFEHLHKRPLISSMAIYKDPKKNDHGDGFYIVAEKLDKGKFKKLKEDLYGFTEAAACRKYWQDEDNYKKYAVKIHERQKTIADLFVALTESDEYSWAEDWKSEYISFVNDLILLQQSIIQNPVTAIDDNLLYNNLSKPVQTYENFMWKWLKEKNNGISSRGQSVLSDDNFYTIIEDAGFKVLAKEVISRPTLENYNMLTDWWYGNEDISNRPLLINRALAACNPGQLSSTVDNSKFWKVIEIVRRSYGFEFTADHQGNWFAANVQLTAWLDSELKEVLDSKTLPRLGQLIWRNIFVWLIYDEFSADENVAPNSLTKKEKPQNGFESIPETKRTFKGFDTDHLSKAKDQKDLGDAGEELVMQYEINKLKQAGLNEQSGKVRIVKDGEGYDVYSYDEKGNEKFIEVKTTTGNELNPFYLSENEVAFMRLHVRVYSIYRVYIYDEENNSGEFFEINGEVENQLLMKPTQFQVLIKKENK